MRRWLCCCALFLMMTVCLAVRPALAYTDSGTCGENVQWALNDDGVLTISGIGPMTDFQISTAPWYAYFIRDNIHQIVIEEGVTTVGTYAFMSLWQVTDVYLPSTLTEETLSPPARPLPSSPSAEVSYSSFVSGLLS